MLQRVDNKVRRENEEYSLPPDTFILYAINITVEDLENKLKKLLWTTRFSEKKLSVHVCVCVNGMNGKQQSHIQC